MDLSLSKQQNELVYLVRQLVQQEIRPLCLPVNPSENQKFDWSVVKVLSKHNLVCPTIPEEYGGLGLDYFTTALIIEEIAAGYPGLAAVIDATLHAVEPILLAGTKKQKEEFLPLLTGSDAGLASFALTESTGGSDFNLINTFAKKSENGFILNGSKDYVINAPVASFISLIAITNHTHKKPSMRLILVPANTPGFKIGKEYYASGMNFAQISETIFDNALIPADLAIKADEAGSGYLLLTQTFDLGRALVGATSVGIARAAYETALGFAENRYQLGSNIKKHQAVSFSLVDMATKIEMARLLTWKACWLIDNGGDYTAASAMAKVAASTIAQEVTCAAADILGARGYEKGSFIEQLVRDARVLSTIEGTNNIQRIVIASLL